MQMNKISITLLSVVLIFGLNSCEFFNTDKEKKQKPKTEKKQVQKSQSKKVEKKQVETKKKAPVAMKEEASTDKFFLIMESFKVPENAVAYNKKLKEEGYESQIIKRANGFLCVSYKGFANKREAMQELKKDRNKTPTANAWLVIKDDV